MRKVGLGILVLAVLFVVRAAVPAVAQDKKGGKKDVAGVIQISEGKDEKFRFFVRDGDDKLLAMSGPGGFATVKDAQEAIDELKAIVAKAKVVVLKKDKAKTDK